MGMSVTRVIQKNIIRPLGQSKRVGDFFENKIGYKLKEIDTYGNNIKVYDKVDKLLPTVLGLWIGGFYLYKTAKADIPKERKQTLFLNNLITSSIGVVGGLSLGKVLDNLKGTMIDKLETSFVKDVEKGLISKSRLQLIKTGTKAAIPLATTSFAFRYLAPVIATPLADVSTKALKKTGIFKAEQERVQEQKLNTVR